MTSIKQQAATPVASRTVVPRDFIEFSDRLKDTLNQGRWDDFKAMVVEYSSNYASPYQVMLLEGVMLFVAGSFQASYTSFCQARALMSVADYPSLLSIYSFMFVQGQFRMEPAHQPMVKMGEQLFEKNIAALAQVDPILAQEVLASSWPKEYQLVDVWSGVHVFSRGEKKIFIMGQEMKTNLAKRVGQRDPLAVVGVSFIQELFYCLKNRYDGIHGMARCHYFFDKDPAMVKLLLSMRDLQRDILEKELFILSGSLFELRLKEILGSFRYPAPDLFLGDSEFIRSSLSQIGSELVATVSEEEVHRYYRSEEFRERQRAIARGEVQPRIFITTSRFTTFLKHSSMDFQKAFGALGCEVQLVIEENNVQSLGDIFYLKQIQLFKPDMYFILSYVRCMVGNGLPKELPCVSFLQDCCGDWWQDADLSSRFGLQDLLVCIEEEQVKMLTRKRVPQEQLLIMPIPADETMFYPLSDDHGLRPCFTADIAYVKHGNTDTDKLFDDWLAITGLSTFKTRLSEEIIASIKVLYRRILSDVSRHWSQSEIVDEICSKYRSILVPETLKQIEYAMVSFSVMVYTACHRRYYLHALHEAGLPMKLYGNAWHQDPVLAGYNGGLVERGEELNAVYNFSKVNLHIQSYSSMHQRLTECGLAGGFIMVNELPEGKDWALARNYYTPDEEVVFFGNAGELIDRCRYYLDHEQERRDIAVRLRARALRERTCKATAAQFLECWRRLLSKSPLPHRMENV